MKVRIVNYVGCARAELDLDGGITLVAGDNAVGKSSVLRGIGALLTGDTMPKGVNKGDSQVMIMDGAKAGELILTTGDSAATVTYPNPKFVTQGEPPQASPIAAGQAAFTDFKEDDRARFLQMLLNALPTHEGLNEALKDYMSAEDIDSLTGMIEREGYDGACERLKEKRVKLKGHWEEVTGQRWGDVKAQQWMPEGWGEYDEQSAEQVSARLAASQEAYERVSKQAAIDEGEYQALVDLLGKREPTQMALDMARRQLPTIEADWANLHGQLETLPPEVETGVPCPHCGAHVVIRYEDNGTFSLDPIEPMTEGEPERRRRAIEAKREEVAEAYRKLEYQQGHIGACEQRLREISAAESKLKGVKKGAQGDPKAVEKAKAQMEKAAASAVRVKLAKDADSTAERVRLYTLVIDLLAPDGLRRRALNAKLAAFEAGPLTLLVKDAPTWKAVTIDRETLMPRYGGRPFVLCSKSEQWRTNTILQIAFAQAEGAAAVCIDGADILSQDGQDDLFWGVLGKLPFPAVVGSMYSRTKLVPNLEKAGIGHSFWMTDGSLYTLAEAMT